VILPRRTGGVSPDPGGAPGGGDRPPVLTMQDQVSAAFSLTITNMVVASFPRVVGVYC